jgi:predicted nucleic-acid-binding Zn-ribbon protein
MLVRCEKCGGNVDVARLRTPRTGEVELAGVFSLDISSIEARVCTNCGYIELYAMQPSEVSGPDVTAEPQYGFYDE